MNRRPGRPAGAAGRRYGVGVRLLPAVLLVALAGCGSDAPSDYSDETRANLLAACSDETDRPIVGDVCTCTYRSIRTRVPYDRLEEIDQRLRGDAGAPLPDEVVDALADCIIEVGAL